MTAPWWHKGVRFQCQGSGKCCTSRGEYGFVYLTKKDRQDMARFFKLSLSEFSKKYCDRTNGVWHLKEIPERPDCVFLKGKSCGIYEARPTQCRTWPFWPEVMSSKAWSKEVVSYCPGVNKGPLISKEEIETQLKLQMNSEKELQRDLAQTKV